MSNHVIKSWDHIERKDWRYGLEVFYDIRYRNYVQHRDERQKFGEWKDEVAEWLKDTVGVRGVDWKWQTFNSRIIVEFQRPTDQVAFVLRFK